MSAAAPAGLAPAAGPDAPDADYPRFTDAELAARSERLDALLEARGADHALIYAANRFGSGVAWLTGWPPTREALVVHTPGERDLLLVNFYNHVPNARAIARTAEVAWAGESAIDTAIAELRRRGKVGSVAVVGPLGHAAFARLQDAASAAIDLDADYARLRLRKSAEDDRVDAPRRRAHRRGGAGAASRGGARRERARARRCDRARVRGGRGRHPHPLPGRGTDVGWGRVRAGAVAVGTTARARRRADLRSQRLVVGLRGPAAANVRRRRRADAALSRAARRCRCRLRRDRRPASAGGIAAELVEAAAAIEEAGFTTRDDLVHGFVGGYLPPILGSPSRALTAVPEFEFEPGMMVVIQPNVVTPDERAGVQTGELMLVTEDGAESLHSYERGLLAAGDADRLAAGSTQTEEER